jgi:hypothetical protein
LTCLNLARQILALRGQREDSFDDVRLRGLIERVESVVPELKIAASGAGTPEPSSGVGTPTTEGATEGIAEGTVTVTGQTQPEASTEGPRTLELPSIEVLRESAQASTSTQAAEAVEAEATDAETLPEARMAAGGRDRAS